MSSTRGIFHSWVNSGDQDVQSLIESLIVLSIFIVFIIWGFLFTRTQSICNLGSTTSGLGFATKNKHYFILFFEKVWEVKCFLLILLFMEYRKLEETENNY